MKASFFRNRLLCIALAASTQTAASAELDVRVADGTDAALLIDFDAFRRSGADIGRMASNAIDDLVRGGAFGEKTGNALKLPGRLFDTKSREAGLKPQDFHWLLCGLRTTEFYVSERLAYTQQVWSAAMAVDGCDWERIGNVATASGLNWQKDTVFGHRVFSADKKQGKVTRHRLRCVPGGDKMAFFGSGASREWECYNADFPQDARFAGMGRLANGEVLRISIASDKPLTDFVRHLYQCLYPMDREPIAERVRFASLSVFLDGQCASAEFQISCADVMDAENLAKAYLAMKTPESIAGMTERDQQMSDGRLSFLGDALLKLKTRIRKDMEVSHQGCSVIVKTGELDAKSALTVFIGTKGVLFDFYENFFK